MIFPLRGIARPMLYILDTEIIVSILRDRSEKVLSYLENKDVDAISVSSLSVMELWEGVYNSSCEAHDRAVIIGFLKPLEVVPFTKKFAIEAARIRSLLKKKEHSLGLVDFVLAAQAIESGRILVTSRLEDFSKVPNLNCIDWMN